MPYRDKEKQRSAQRRYYEENRGRYKERHRVRSNKLRRFVTDYKNGRSCADCGIAYPHYVMDFDHVRGTKVREVSATRFFSSVEELMREIEKCDLVCSNCHRHRTWMRQQDNPHPHTNKELQNGSLQ